ncbi:3-isopropylmalate/(R)-2-methylmalate dehydratase large subunit [Amycolatopsis bartoniae]|uniref:3-isopropylmalate dehydratase large subunit n=1 Tax=Amycolatopsis bartoniae TaxID=941986 RepID=A0A8H9MC61_9PSEU|nr:aconitase/3-isopropylmalate dehydratase large subunit family protein [Amycolatopsis bartoniae]MBB2938601.1 3-isopropylmalate/(R)-2-methylmalate dehydratase large subunit [Amycolatopsis bartoniae]GHF69832.1 3-isopropylmalate dehydratase large subunit [Amycolatopsis bartoniae]
MLPGEPLANQIVAAHAGREAVGTGELVSVGVDRVYLQDGNSPTIARLFEQHGLDSVFDPDRIAFVFDHSVLVPDRKMADRLREATVFARNLGARILPRGAGISHVIALEEGWFEPGSLVLGSDSHTCTGGAVQSMGLGMGATDIAAAMVTGRTWLKVPETVWLRVRGVPHPAVRAKDVVLEALRVFGQRPFLYRSVEWVGEWAAGLSLDSAASVASMGVEMGAKCVFLPAAPGRPPGLVPLEPPGEAKVLELPVGDLRPMVALPHSPFDSVPVDDVAGQRVDYVFIGSCTNSRLEDIAEVAGVLADRPVHPDVHCVVTPGSRQTYLEASRRGYLDVLTQAGALVTPPGCGACVGTQGTVPAGGERVLSTMNRNFRGRMGNPDAEIFLSSPLVAATAAVLGRFPATKEVV